MENLETWHKPLFQMPQISGKGRMEPSIANVMELFLSDALINTIVECSNDYATKNMVDGRIQSPIKHADILRFFAIYFYFGMVCCPYKQDYWSSDHRFWPLHPVVQSITQDCYKYVWKNISFVKVEELDEEREIDEESESDKDSDGEEEEEDKEEEEEEEEPAARTVDEASWYKKVGL